MNKFERIVREPLVMGGQARIRDTKITVNEIVRLSLDGKSQAEILTQFPSLEAEDVHQALAWHSDFLTGLGSGILFENRTVYSTIRGYSELSLFMIENRDKEAIEFEKVMEWLNLVRENARRIQETMQITKEWLGLPYRFSRIIEPYILDFIDLKEFLSEETLSSFDAQVPHKFEVMGITEPYDILHMLCTAQINWEENGAKGEISFRKENQAIYLSVSRKGELIPSLLNEYTNLHFVSLLIHESGSELKIQQEENRVIFEFSLPIVQET